MTQFGVHPDTRSPVARRIEAAAALRQVERDRLAYEQAEAIRRAKVIEQARWSDARRPWEKILREVAAKHGLRISDICGPSSERNHIVPARFEAVWRIFSETTLSKAQISRRFDRDHSVIDKAVKSHMRRNGITELPAHRRRVREEVAG